MKDTYKTIIPGASHWSFVARRNVRVTFTDTEGGANIGLLFFNPNLLSEKYNAPDTLKCQHTFKLTKGNCLYSDMGRIFASIIEDDFGWHETVCGSSHASHIEKRWGKRDYQSQSNHWLQNGYDSFLTEMAKYEMGRRALASNLNLFSQVSTDSEGNMSLSAQSGKGHSVTLRFEMDTLVIMHTCPHPLNAEETYPNKPVQVAIEKGPAAEEDDFCLNFRPENRRGFENNALYHLGM